MIKTLRQKLKKSTILKNLRMKNPKDIICSYININSIRNKFDNLCDLISKNVDILSVAETKLNPSFPNSQFLIPGFHEPISLDINSKRVGILVYTSLHRHQELCLILSYPKISKFYHLIYISGKRSGCLSVFISHL